MSATTKIVIQGKEYNSIEELPPELRVAYQKMIDLLGDNNGDGFPDILQSGGFNSAKLSELKNIAQDMKANVKTIHSAVLRASEQSTRGQALPSHNFSKPTNTGSQLFIMGVIIVAFLLMALGIFLFRSGLIHF